MDTSGLLLSRLFPPRPPPDCLPRDDLVSRVISGLDGRLVAILGGAGYGKTTLLTQAIARVEQPSVWCSCDERLTHPALLVAYLAAGIERAFPGFGADLHLKGSPEAQVIALSNEIVTTIPEDFILALDDVHLLPPQTAATVILLLADLPVNVHVAATSRAPLPATNGRARSGRVLTIGVDDLALSDVEAAELVRRSGRPINDAALTELHRVTEGWMTGVLLAAQSQQTMDQGRGGHFDYLAHEVFEAQDRDLREFLLDTAVLGRFTPAVAAAVTARDDAAGVCHDLVTRHLFTIRLSGDAGWYRYHHLFRDFVLGRLVELDPGRIPILHRRAATAWLESGEAREAVHHLLMADDHESAAAVLAPIADRMLTSPEAGTLRGWLDQMPQAVVERHTELLLARASLVFHDGDHDGGFRTLERALAELIDRGEHDLAAAAFFRLIYMQLAGGTKQQWALEVGERQLPRIDRAAALLPASYVMMASEYGCAGRYEDAEAALAEITKLSTPTIAPLGNVYMQATRALFLDHPAGRSEQALATLDWAIDAIHRAERFDDLAFQLACRAYRAIVLNHLGRFDEALVETERLVAAAIRLGVAPGTDRVMVKLRAVALAGLERYDELATELARAEPWAVLANTSYAFRIRTPAARLAAARGDRVGVAEHVRAVRSSVEDFGFSFDVPMWMCDLAGCAVDVGLTDEARETQQQAVATADRAQTPWARTRAALMGAVVYAETPEGDRWLQEALLLTADRGFAGIWTRRDRRYSARSLARAVALGLGPPGVAAGLATQCGAEVLAECADLLAGAPVSRRRELATAIGDRDPEIADQLLSRRRSAQTSPAPAQAGAARPPLRIASLGGFVVTRGGDPVPRSAFGRERARGILAALLCAGRPVHREELLEWFWPDLSPDRALRVFHVALHGLRRALEPELQRGAAASIIVNEGETYHVRLGPHDAWDVDEFLALARNGVPGEMPGARLARLKRAEQIKIGTLYPEWPYAEWAEERRREVDAAGRLVLEELAHASRDAGELREAIARYRGLVDSEPEREEWHRGLMRAFADAGERALALRQYHACRAVLRRELGVEASAETRHLYATLLDDEPAVASGRQAALTKP